MGVETMSALLEMNEIDKSFSGVSILRDVHFDLRQGEVHALMGENGAGKSTLMKILGGIYRKDHGTIVLDGVEQEFLTPDEAMKAGISIIHQELNMIPSLTVMENLFLGRELTMGKSGWLRKEQMRKRARESLNRLGLEIDPNLPAERLSVGQQQMVEIAKALSLDAKILIMDEPTASLTDREIERLFKIIEQLKQDGVGIIYISHRIEEIFQISDRITVLRDGQFIGCKETRAIDVAELVKMMVGRELGERFPKREATIGKEILKVEDLSSIKGIHGISFTLHEGEILGIAGLMGAGRTELVRAIFGADRSSGGTLYLDGNAIKITSPRDAIRHGIALVTEDRKMEGLVLPLSVRENLSLPNLGQLSRASFVMKSTEEAFITKMIKDLNIKAASPEQEVRSLSGGNQQKIVIGKWLGIMPRILILDEPTRGVDVGAKKEIYTIMNQLTQKGVSIIMVSSELPEVLGMSDRVLVMHEGHLTGLFSREEATQESIMLAATGGERA